MALYLAVSPVLNLLSIIAETVASAVLASHTKYKAQSVPYPRTIVPCRRPCQGRGQFNEKVLHFNYTKSNLTTYRGI